MGRKNNGHYTPTQEKLLEVLSDGKPHSRYELHQTICHELDGMNNLQVHICYLRKNLPSNKELICQLINGVTHYRLLNLNSVD